MTKNKEVPENKAETKVKEKEEEFVELENGEKQNKNYHEAANDIAAQIKDNFDDFKDFLGSFLQIYARKFGEDKIQDHLENVNITFRLSRLGLIKGEDKKDGEK